MSNEAPPGPPPASGGRSWSDLGPRLGSAAVLIAITVAGLVLGGLAFAALVGLVFAGCYREWETMVTLRPLSAPGIALIVLVALSAIVFVPWGALASAAVIAIACVVAAALRGPEAPWRIGGLLFFGAVVVALLTIRGADWSGVLAGAFLGTVIWLTDTGAFFTGRQLGGEKLAPGISPSKTWSGALGGLALGTLAGTILWVFVTASPVWIGALLAAATSILGQLGDLTESALKRRFRVKDSGDIIPGHGGLMDRLDSLTFGVLFMLLVGGLHLGLGNVARGFLLW